MSAAPAPTHRGDDVGHETRDVNLRPITIAVIGLVIAVVVAVFAMLGFFDFLAAREARLSPPENPLAAAAGPRVPPQPRLQVAPIKDLRELRGAERSRLDGYAWVDRGAGVVRIPIERAMEIMAGKSEAPR